MSISLKSKNDIEKMKIAGNYAAKVLEYLEDFVQVGISTEEIDNVAYKYITEELKCIPANVGYNDYPKTLCTSINDVICHGIPSEERILEEGDAVNVDVTAIIDNHYGDTSRMFCIGKTSVKLNNLIDATHESMMRAIKILKPGKNLSVIIDQRDKEGKLLFASQDGNRRDLTFKNLLICYLKHPLMSFKVISAIHFEALKLWIKGVKLIKKNIKIKNNTSEK